MSLCPLCTKRQAINGNPHCSTCTYNLQKGTPPKERKVYTIPKVSPKKRKREKELKAVRDRKREEIRFCQSCGTTDGFISYSHILPVGMFQEFETEPLNAIMQCIPCHDIWGNGTLEEKMRQSTFRHCVEVILQLKPSYLNLLLNKKDGK